MSQHIDSQRELDYQICSNRPLVYICSHEEQRVVDAIREVCTSRAHQPNWNLVSWDIGDGLSVVAGDVALPKDDISDQLAILQWYAELESGSTYTVLLLKDFHKFIGSDGHSGQTEYRVVRTLRNLAQNMVGEFKCIIIIAPMLFLPSELERICAVIDWPLPQDEEIASRVSELLVAAAAKSDIATRFQTQYDVEQMGEIVRAFRGLTLEQIQLLCTYLMLTKKELDAASISAHKRDAIRKSTILEWIDSSESISTVGGMDGLKEWLERRKSAFTEEAAQYGLPCPRGVLLVGIQGAGKSLMAKAVAAHMKQPLLRLDFGRIYTSLLGSSEQNLRTAIKVAESIEPCVVWCDELEKGFSGTGSGMSDGGTASRVFATFLTWMQEKTGPVFIIATANDVSQLPPEMLRKGRFDEIFFVDLPDAQERAEIFEIHLRRTLTTLKQLDEPALIEASNQLTGAEIEAAIIEAMHDAFLDNKRAICTEDILLAISETVPLSRTMTERIANLRAWAQDRARSAHTKRKTSTKPLDSQPKRVTIPLSTLADDEEL